MRDRQLRRTQPEAVPPLREKMKLRRNLRILESLKVDKSVLDMSRVVILGLKQERRRSLRDSAEATGLTLPSDPLSQPG